MPPRHRRASASPRAISSSRPVPSPRAPPTPIAARASAGAAQPPRGARARPRGDGRACSPPGARAARRARSSPALRRACSLRRREAAPLQRHAADAEHRLAAHGARRDPSATAVRAGHRRARCPCRSACPCERNVVADAGRPREKVRFLRASDAPAATAEGTRRRTAAPHGSREHAAASRALHAARRLDKADKALGEMKHSSAASRELLLGRRRAPSAPARRTAASRSVARRRARARVDLHPSSPRRIAEARPPRRGARVLDRRRRRGRRPVCIRRRRGRRVVRRCRRVGAPRSRARGARRRTTRVVPTAGRGESAAARPPRPPARARSHGRAGDAAKKTADPHRRSGPTA